MINVRIIYIETKNVTTKYNNLKLINFKKFLKIIIFVM